jgi:hypothetical protein
LYGYPDLRHQIFRQTQVIEGLLQDLGGLLRLSVVALEACSGGTARRRCLALA